MPSTIGYRLRIRDAADSSDVLVVSSVRGDTNPDAVSAPSGDGAEFDPFTGSYRSGSMTFSVADAITSGTDRLVTAKLEDATFRQQLTSRPAYIERSIDGGAWEVIQAGIVTGLRLSNAAQWDIDVGDATRATRNLVAFAPKRDAVDATKVEPLADYLARWPARGCMAGGPILGGFLTVPDLGGWEMQVESSRSWNGGTIKRLKFRAGYAAPRFARTTNPADVRDALNDALGDAYGGIQASTFPDDLGDSPLRDVVVEIDGVPYAAANLAQHDGTGIAINTGQGFFLDGHPIDGFEVVDPSNALTVGSTTVRVRVYDALPSERSPIYYTGHPLALWTALCDEAGLAYDSAAVTTTTQALGTSLRINLRITSSQAWSSFVEGTLYGPCGFSVRTGTDGTLIPFPTRITNTDLPSVEVTNADVPQTGAVLFDLSEPDAITKVTFNQQNLRPSTALVQRASGAAVPRGSGGQASASARTAVARVAASALDGITVQQVEVIRTSGDAGGPVQREQTYTIPGFLDTGSGSYEPGLVDALALQLFDRAGRGRLSGEIALLRDGSAGSVVLGDEMVVSLKAMPNHNKRYGDDTSVGGRCVQIVRLTPTAWGAQAKFIDSGPNAQPATPVPTLSLTAGPAGAGVALTITNAATLNAASPPIGVRVQWAPSSGVPASTDYSDVLAFPAGAVPTGATLLPLATLGYTVYAKARSEQAGKRPSAYSAAVSLATTGLAAPSAFTVTPSGTDGSIAAGAWTNGSATAYVDVWIRRTADPASADVRVIALEAGSVAYSITGLTPGVAYTASVQHRDPATGAVSTKTTAAFTAGATTVTLPAPTAPAGIVGSTDPLTGVGHLDGTYGLDVVAAIFPGTITFWEAIETGVGTGLYGSFVQVSGLVPAVSGGVTSWRGVSANALLRKQLKARHEADGMTPSPYTSAVTLDAWGVVQGPPLPSLTVTPTPGSSSWSLAYAGNGVIELAIDGGSYATAPASPIIVTLDGSAHTYAFRAVLDGRATLPSPVSLPALPTSGTGPSITGILAFNAVYPGDGGGSFDVSWVSNNIGSDATYDIAGTVTVGNTSGPSTFSSLGNAGSPVTISHPLGPSAPSVRFTITAKQDSVAVCTGVFPEAAVSL